jgi:hypothetical protein
LGECNVLYVKRKKETPKKRPRKRGRGKRKIRDKRKKKKNGKNGKKEEEIKTKRTINRQTPSNLSSVIATYGSVLV